MFEQQPQTRCRLRFVTSLYFSAATTKRTSPILANLPPPSKSNIPHLETGSATKTARERCRSGRPSTKEGSTLAHTDGSKRKLRRRSAKTQQLQQDACRLLQGGPPRRIGYSLGQPVTAWGGVSRQWTNHCTYSQPPSWHSSCTSKARQHIVSLMEHSNDAHYLRLWPRWGGVVDAAGS